MSDVDSVSFRPVSTPDFVVARSTHEGTEIVHVCGEVDLATTAEVEQALDQACEASAAGVVADYSRVTFMDSTGLSVLIRTRGRLVSEGRKFAVCATEWPVRNVFETSGVGDLLGPHRSLEAALDAIT